MEPTMNTPMGMPPGPTDLEDPMPVEQDIANEVPAPLTFTPDQQVALFGGPAEPGAEYTITVRAGEPGPDGGDLTFEVVSTGDSGEGESETEDEGMVEDGPEATAALGYDRNALRKKQRTKETPPMGAGFLEED